MLDLHSTTQVVSRLNATVLGKRCVVQYQKKSVINNIAQVRDYIMLRYLFVLSHVGIRDTLAICVLTLCRYHITVKILLSNPG